MTEIDKIRSPFHKKTTVVSDCHPIRKALNFRRQRVAFGGVDVRPLMEDEAET